MEVVSIAPESSLITGIAYGARSLNRLFEKSSPASAATVGLSEAIATATAMALNPMVNVCFVVFWSWDSVYRNNFQRLLRSKPTKDGRQTGVSGFEMER